MRYNDKELCKDKLYSELFNVCSNLNRKTSMWKILARHMML